MKTPSLYRKKRNGRHYGAWLVSLQGAEVNLGTKNAELARQRLVEALRGKREFPSDAELAAQALEADLRGAAAGASAAPVSAAAAIPDPAAAPQAPVPAAAPVVPDAIEPPRAMPPMPTSEQEARAEAEATNAAAAETAGAGGPGSDQAGAPAFSPDALEGMLVTAAGALVQVQIALQSWAVEKKTGKRPPVLPEQLAGPLSEAAAQGWVAQFKRWFPDMADCPPWIVAVGAPLLLLPIQVAAAEPVEKQADPAPAQAAA